MTNRSKSSSLWDTIRGLFKTDIPPKASQDPTSSTRSKNVMYISDGVKSWKEVASRGLRSIRKSVQDMYTPHPGLTYILPPSRRNAINHLPPSKRSAVTYNIIRQTDDHLQSAQNRQNAQKIVQPKHTHALPSKLSSETTTRTDPSYGHFINNNLENEDISLRNRKDYQNFVYINEFKSVRGYYSSVDVSKTPVIKYYPEHQSLGYPSNQYKTCVRVPPMNANHVSQNSSPLLPVDVSNAGEGNLEISIVGNNRNIQNHCKQVGPGSFEVSYVPQEGVQHHAHITFNNEHVPGKRKFTV